MMHETVMVSLPILVRLRITGRDRAKYLHNFCTNAVKTLVPGGWCEAFFTDVKAHILAHGWVLAGSEHHELWMLGGEESAILKHLQKYVITEDVDVTSGTATITAIAVFGAEAPAVLAGCSPHASNLPAGQWGEFRMAEDDTSATAILLRTEWAGTPLFIGVAESACAEHFREVIRRSGVRPAERQDFERLRIRERFPIIGVDMTFANLAPEAQRDASAISYVKGCYLGQEPIARLDAMGHVNRGLRSLTIDAPADRCTAAIVRSEDGKAIGNLTSVCPDSRAATAVGLAVVKVHGLDLTRGVTVESSQGEIFSAQVL